MIKLTNILLENLTLYEVQILMKSRSDFNRLDISNQLRALPGVVVLEIQQNNLLDSKKTPIHEYTLLKLKFLSGINPQETLKRLRHNALQIKGIDQFFPRTKTLIKKFELKN